MTNNSKTNILWLTRDKTKITEANYKTMIRDTEEYYLKADLFWSDHLKPKIFWAGFVHPKKL